jgi:hypothetical protein
MAGGGAALQLLVTQRYGEAGRLLQLAAMARPAEHWSSLLWRGLQSIAAHCYGEASSELQLVVAAMASSAATRGDGQQRAVAFLFFFVFYSTTSREKKRETEREREGEPLKPVQRSPLCWLAGM